MNRPIPAPPWFPYHSHRTMEQVLRAEHRDAVTLANLAKGRAARLLKRRG